MRHSIRGLSAGMLLLAIQVTTLGGGPDPAKDLVDRAIKASGGAAKLAPLKAGLAKAKANIQDGNQQVAATIDVAWQGLDKYRFTVAADLGGMAKNMIVVIDAGKGWAKDLDRHMTKDAPAEAPPLIAAVLYALRMPHLLPALLDKDVKLTPLAEAQIDGRAALGVTVAHKDQKDVRLFFDKETGLPARSEIRVTEPSGKEADFAFTYHDYKDQAGLKHPTRIHIKTPDKANIVVEVTELTPRDKVDAKLFAKPE
jgi:hypothetical protein